MMKELRLFTWEKTRLTQPGGDRRQSPQNIEALVNGRGGRDFQHGARDRSSLMEKEGRLREIFTFS